MLKITHFINLTYGRPFIDQYLQLPAEYWRELDVTLVFSLGMRRPAHWMRRIRFGIKAAQLRKAYQKQFAGAPFRVRVEEDVNSSKFIKQLPKDSLGICSGFNQIFSGALIQQFQQCVNFHPSLLPYYRGPVPSYWCLQNKEEFSGITLHEMTEKIDQGKILYQEEVAIEKGETEESLDQKIGRVGAKVLKEWLGCQLNDRLFEIKIVDADHYYQVKQYYYSFP